MHLAIVQRHMFAIAFLTPFSWPLSFALMVKGVMSPGRNCPNPWQHFSVLCGGAIAQKLRRRHQTKEDRTKKRKILENERKKFDTE